VLLHLIGKKILSNIGKREVVGWEHGDLVNLATFDTFREKDRANVEMGSKTFARDKETSMQFHMQFVFWA
jgi:hypothetical protein